jgi:hypothetical protein
VNGPKSELPTPRPAKPSRVDAGRAAAKVVKLAAASAAAVALGVFAIVAKATHPGKVTHGAASSVLSAPKAFVQALDTGLSPGSVGPATGPAQTVSGGS